MDFGKRTDRLIASGRTRAAPVLLGFGMLVSLAFVLYAGRGTTFSNDEHTWLIMSQTLTFANAFEPQNGHLLLVTRPLYALLAETIGTDYLVYRLLALVMVFVSVGLLFEYLRRRTGDYVALAPCLVLLFFGSDWLHLIQGNGFTVMLAVAAGVLALLALDRNSTAGNVVACLALCLGLITYSVSLAFLAGAIIAVLAGPDARRRLWTVMIPAGLYLAWSVWIRIKGFDQGNGTADLTNIFLAPAWTFQSLSGILSSITGFNYDFSSAKFLPHGEMAGPPLALAFLALVGWRISRRGISAGLAVALTVAAVLFLTQVLIWEADGRQPASSRYLYPGAFVVLMVLAESIRGVRLNRLVFISIWVVAACGLATNVMITGDFAAQLRTDADTVKADVSAAVLVGDSLPPSAGLPSDRLLPLVSEATLAYIGPAESEFGGIGFDDPASAPPAARSRIDSVVAGALGLELAAVPGSEWLNGCSVVEAGGAGAGETGPAVAELPAGGAVLGSKTGGKVALRRFGDEFSSIVGRLPKGEYRLLAIPADNDPTPWQVTLNTTNLEICPLGDN